ncbi:hypothetical protein BEWA_012180 [Theileria equi strain WA]|uniref:Uncharacterized protein n=1 Tax=Theileria equi strain WA TaxID=1537102 RepID=L1LBL0_THEEQ|nr:hypothetical protein BEWA_012180 [Theileria equi strain WA]EKX72659.1 hypothetical protein BEWA_012180 [Theileria equi strain WA]|eukprot:XP_004832111.1 hypothetical protein BEWA_012180 [Theileria equi strain WA]
MTDFTFDVGAHLDTKRFAISGGVDNFYVYATLKPKDGFKLTKVINGVHVLWESSAFLFLKLSNEALYFEFKGLSWNAIGEPVYKEKLTLGLDRHNFEGVDFDLSHINPKNAMVIKILDGSFVNHSFFPEVKKAFVTVLLRVMLVVSGVFAHKFFERVDGKWVPCTLKGYFDKRAPKDTHLTVLDFSASEHPFIILFGGVKLGLPYDVFLSSVLGKVVKVVDGNEVLWEGKGLGGR